MTLRVTLSIVPHGIEEDIYNIHQINISNLGPYNKDLLRSDVCEYGVEVDKYKTEEYDYRIIHDRKDGPITLVSLALKEII